jgi:hypothetical protein
VFRAEHRMGWISAQLNASLIQTLK